MIAAMRSRGVVPRNGVSQLPSCNRSSLASPASRSSPARRSSLARWLACAALLAACGGSDDGGEPPASPDASRPDAAAPPPDASIDAPGAPDAMPEPPPVPPDDGDPATFSAVLRVLDEDGAPVAGAEVDIDGAVQIADHRGYVVLANHRDPVVVVIAGAGLLTQPVIVGHARDGQIVEVVMRARAGGARWSMHVAGDMMLARRYYEPLGDQPALIDPADIAAGARRVVAPVARAFAAADLSTVNLETVVSTLPDSAAYPKKRVIINSHPDTLAALEAMGVDVVMLGNNHIRDYFDQGVAATKAALDARGMPHVGAAASGSEPANAPFVFEAGRTRVGILSYSMLSGDSTNDGLARNGDPVPPSLDPDDAWEYEARSWAFDGAVLDVQRSTYRAGTAWRLFRAEEANMPAAEVADAWASLSSVYPELQDIVARRGHGGAAFWTTSRAVTDIAALRQSADAVIVQIHGSAEFQHAPSAFVVDAARAAIDAGADAVLLHHPHVIQGFDWYKGKLIAYSLGNFIFDQEEHSTTPTGFLRLEWEDSRIIEARVVPLDLGNYRPNPVADARSEHHLLSLWEKSQLGVFVDRDDADDVRMILREPDADTRFGQLRMQHEHAIITDAAPAAESVRVEVPAGARLPLPVRGLVHARAGGAAVLLGRELLGWGGFEDPVADGAATHAMHWNLEHSDADLVVGNDAGHGFGYATLRRKSSNTSDASLFTAPRVPVPEHRWFHDDSGTPPADGAATYTVELSARMVGAGSAYLRIDLYPTEGLLPDPGKRGEIVLPIDVPADGAWHPVSVDVPASSFVISGARMEGMRLNFRLRPPATDEAVFSLDDVRVIEWRPAADMADRFGAFTYIRNDGAGALAADLRVLPLRDR
jgi:poly-gamma-glutamate capsule biosynthesis protein CapA/YwtB (metallophosphatase superfamily)